MEIMDEFEKREEIGRAKMRTRFSNKYQLDESENIKEVWDFSGKTQHLGEAEQNYFVEVKDRDAASTTYKTAYLEVPKLNGLLDIANANGNAAIIYANFYTDGYCYLFNLRKISLTDVTISKMLLKHKTVKDVGMKEKLIVELPLSLGKKFKYNN